MTPEDKKKHLKFLTERRSELEKQIEAQNQKGDSEEQQDPDKQVLDVPSSKSK